MQISVRVQHHPSRAHLLPGLLARLAGFADVVVVPDPQPDGKPDAWRAHRACLLALPDDADYLLVVQDDALLADDFCERLTAAIERHPEEMLLAFTPGFGHMRRLMVQAQRAHQDATRMIVGAFVPLVCTLYPREVASGLLDWADHGAGDRHRRPLYGADDGIVAHYCRKRRIQPLAMVPCAADHDDMVVTVGRPAPRQGTHRRAALL